MNTLKRKLAAILSADVAGYSRLMSDDEEATVHTIKTYRKVIESLIVEHRGRLVDSPGDNMLAEFASVVDALRCAWDIQKEIASRNLDLAEHRRMTFRIGINLGDVIEEEGGIYGDGVNVAARLESLAESGGISISGAAYNHVKNKVSFRFENQGEQSVKNIDEPIQVYRVVMESEDSPIEVIQQKPTNKWKRNLSIALVVFFLVLAGAAAYVWDTYFRIPDVERLTGQKDEFKLPEGPSIAVLPFDNMSRDPEQEYICDGITENIITSLSYNPKLFVIARNSSFYFKGKQVIVQEVAKKLGVQYVLEGSFQKSGDRVRINAQLIDANTGHHLWADRYDRELKEIFILQDEITENIIKALAVKLTHGEGAKIYFKYPISFEAGMKLTEAWSYCYKHNKEDNISARHLAEQALTLSPEHPEPYLVLASTYMNDFVIYDTSFNSLAQATKLTKLALDIDDKNPRPYLLLCNISMLRGYHEKAISMAKRAIALNPNYGEAYLYLGTILVYADKPDKGVEFIKKAIRLNPIPPSDYFLQLGNGYRMLGRYKKAITALNKAIDLEPHNIMAHLSLTAAYSLSGQSKKAHREFTEVYRINPDFSLEHLEKQISLLYKNKDEKEKIYQAVRKAGLK